MKLYYAVIDDMKREHDLELANRLAEAEQRLNDSRREQTKSGTCSLCDSLVRTEFVYFCLI